MSFEKPSQATAADEVEEAGSVFGTGDVLDETDDLPSGMEARVPGGFVIGEHDVAASDADGFVKHLNAFFLRVLVKRQQQQAGIERSVLKRKLVGGALDVIHVPSAGTTRNGHHVVGQIETRRPNPGSPQRSALISRCARDVEDVPGLHLSADANHPWTQRPEKWIDQRAVYAHRSRAISRLPCHGRSIDAVRPRRNLPGETRRDRIAVPGP